MSRIGWLLIALLSILLIVAWYFLIFDPTSAEIEDVRAQTEQARNETTQQLARAQALREVRQSAPESESALSASRLVIPEQASMPSLFRQLQMTADEAGVRLNSISPTPPSVAEFGETQVAVIPITMTLEGTYFQIVDLARRIEDPQLTPRALRWTTANLAPLEFPELTVTLSGQVYARGIESLPSLEPEEPPVDPDAEDPEADELQDDLEVEP